MAKADYSTWITKQHAAEVIGVSTKAIERWAQEKQIQVARWKRPAGGPAIVVCHPGDVERIARERHPETETFVVPAPPKEQPVTNGVAVKQPSAEQFWQALVAAIGNSQKSETRLYLTVEEAEEYSGLPATTLREWITTGRLPAIDVGVRRGGRWRIRKADLHRIHPTGLETPGNVLGDLDQDEAVVHLPRVQAGLLKP